MAKLMLQQIQRMARTYPTPAQRLPQQRIRLVRIRHFHPIHLHENEIVELLRHDGRVELRDYFPHGSGFARSRRAGDVDAAAGTVGDGGFEVRVDGAEGFFAAREGVGDGGDVKAAAGDLEGGGGHVAGGEDAGAKGGELEGFFNDDAFVCWGCVFR